MTDKEMRQLIDSLMPLFKHGYWKEGREIIAVLNQEAHARLAAVETGR